MERKARSRTTLHSTVSGLKPGRASTEHCVRPLQSESAGCTVIVETQGTACDRQQRILHSGTFQKCRPHSHTANRRIGAAGFISKTRAVDTNHPRERLSVALGRPSESAIPRNSSACSHSPAPGEGNKLMSAQTQLLSPRNQGADKTVFKQMYSKAR